MSKFLIGDEKVMRLFRELPKKLAKRGTISAGRKAAKPIVAKARAIVKRGTKTRGNLQGFEHLLALSKFTKSVVFKGAINVKIDPNAPDLPMASGRRLWNAFSVGKLFADGRRNAKGRWRCRTEHFKPRQQNLWVVSGSGRRPS